MGLSSEIIWHQTSLNGGLSILESKRIYCAYSLETIKWGNHTICNAFPMISFCDLPLADMHEYLRKNKTYELTGRYGEITIGFNKEFRQKHRISPVWYLPSNSNFLGSLMKFRNRLSKIDRDFGELIWNSLAFSKNYEGILKKYGFSSYCFYDEQEVRYVPTLETIKENKTKPFLKENEYTAYKDKIEKERGIKAPIISNLFIDFKLSDVEFILVAKRKYISQFQSLLEGQNHSVKILTYGQISKDVLGLTHSILGT